MTTIQAVITLYCLVMAMLIMTGAKIGDMIGRRRAFVIGLIIYACGSALTAVSQSVGPRPRVVGTRGHRCGARASRARRLDRRQLRGLPSKGRLRRHRWRCRSGDRRWPHPGRVGDHERDLADRLRR